MRKIYSATKNSESITSAANNTFFTVTGKPKVSSPITAIEANTAMLLTISKCALVLMFVTKAVVSRFRAYVAIRAASIAYCSLFSVPLWQKTGTPRTRVPYTHPSAPIPCRQARLRNRRPLLKWRGDLERAPALQRGYSLSSSCKISPVARSAVKSRPSGACAMPLLARSAVCSAGSPSPSSVTVS